VITFTAPTGGVTSGQGVLVGNLFGVAATTTAEGESVEIATVGVYELPKLASAVIAAGARVAWDDTAKQVVLPGTGMVPIGVATVAAGNGATTVRVRLDGVATQAA
jgi:predicted RecA/RadA family phage recombinase